MDVRVSHSVSNITRNTTYTENIVLIFGDLNCLAMQTAITAARICPVDCAWVAQGRTGKRRLRHRHRRSEGVADRDDIPNCRRGCDDTRKHENWRGKKGEGDGSAHGWYELECVSDVRCVLNLSGFPERVLCRFVTGYEGLRLCPEFRHSRPSAGLSPPSSSLCPIQASPTFTRSLPFSSALKAEERESTSFRRACFALFGLGIP
ncbi:hypothetical protein DENSPDRAFT_561794 [Dentipellis sp. KUC8613]|nr:hypothetical protein DENSPDRAFT_561794 [Dentipellis sp. KUC8613]